ncbi:MAG TPA: bifunctional serine/threonine-protein kinase/universal stress protein [Roseococcus sp.]|jgi:protein-serine/threonine kinase|nr:bifunctional serine/threonine-protein kinase/universal stress protein [Roseococcus sp.]
MAREGTVLGGFTLGPVVHRGGMAILHAATHPDHAGPLLVKVPRLAEGEDPAAIVGFEMERMILPRLTGPHVPRCLGTGHEPLPWIAMGRVEGASLLPKLEALPLPAEEVASLGARIADALDSLHRQGVVHMDVKPSNVILAASDGRAVLVDFGLSHHAQLPDLLEEEFRLPYGTAPYMAPEQAMGVRGDPASDLFALGAVLYFFATGVRPFGDPQRLPGLRRRVWWDPPPPRALRPDCPPWLQEVILHCLEVEPARRPPGAAHVAFALRHPDQVALGVRAARLARDPLSERLRRRFHPDHRPLLARACAPEPAADAPIIAVAVELDGQPAMQAALRPMVAQALLAMPGARLACLNVLRTNRVMLDTTLDEAGRNKHLQRLLELRHWAEPLGLPEGRVTHHVLEAASVAGALLDYLGANRVDHVVLGASGEGAARRVLGSVSGEVARLAPCSVTVVRPRG